MTGRAGFGIDIQLPDMLYAAVVHSPVAGTNVASFDAGNAPEMPGVQGVFEAGAPGYVRAVAVVAENSWQALQAAMSLQQLGHSHNAQVHGIVVDPDGARIIREQAKRS